MFAKMTLFLVLSATTAAATIRYTLKYGNDGATPEPFSVPRSGSFELPKSSKFTCGGLQDPKNASLLVTCKQLTAKNSGGSAVFHCPPASKDRELGGLSVFGENELWRIQVFCNS